MTSYRVYSWQPCWLVKQKNFLPLGNKFSYHVKIMHCFWHQNGYIYFFSILDGYPELDLLFAISLSAVNPNTQNLMKDITQSVIKRFGIDRIRYGVIVFGNSAVTKFDFGSILPDQTSIINAVKALQKVDESTSPNLKTAMETAQQRFENGAVRENVRRVLVILIDKDTSSTKAELETVKKSLQDKRVTIIPAAVGPNVNPEKLYNVTVFRDLVTRVPVGANPAEAAEEIIRKVPRK